eukprot:26012-Eustigmatos_ZCMA.PRE.1
MRPPAARLPCCTSSLFPHLVMPVLSCCGPAQLVRPAHLCVCCSCDPQEAFPHVRASLRALRSSFRARGQALVGD